jgi:methyl-accepting chemotaxis protein
MARNISDASGSSRDISGSLVAVTGAATETSSAIEGTQAAVNELATMSATLHTLVRQFKV